MNNFKNFTFRNKHLLLLIQFFLIIFIYHTLKDLKDTIIITASPAGAEVIPFIKIWGMLPLAVFVSFLFSKINNRFNREQTFAIFTGVLLIFYVVFAFVLYPWRDELHLNALENCLKTALPVGCRGLITMLSFWHYTLFYLAAEIWSILVLAILFWGYVNETTTLEEAKKFYPLCMFTGNFAGILSGGASYTLSYHLKDYLTWQDTLQAMILMVFICGFLIIGINRVLETIDPCEKIISNKKKKCTSFKDNILKVGKSSSLLCIAILVIGFGLTSNLVEVAWKESIKNSYPDPQAYNSYMNQITSLIGIFAVCMALISRWIFSYFSWSKVVLITPVTLFFTSLAFFSALLLPQNIINSFSQLINISPLLLITTLGSIHYIIAMTAKYTIFDACKEMAFLSVDLSERTNAKSVIDSLGSRLGKTTASCLYQFLLIFFGSMSGHLSIIAITSMLTIALSMNASWILGRRLSSKAKEDEGKFSLKPGF